MLSVYLTTEKQELENFVDFSNEHVDIQNAPYSTCILHFNCGQETLIFSYLPGYTHTHQILLYNVILQVHLTLVTPLLSMTDIHLHLRHKIRLQ